MSDPAKPTKPAWEGRTALLARISSLEADLAKAKTAPSAPAAARIVETATRQTAAELSKERRSVPAPAASKPTSEQVTARAMAAWGSKPAEATKDNPTERALKNWSK